MASQLQLASSRHMAAFLDHHLKTNNNSSSFGKDPHHHHLICKSPFSCSCHANATPPEESFISGGSAKRGGTKKIATPRCSDGTWTPGGKRPILEIGSDKAGRCIVVLGGACMQLVSKKFSYVVAHAGRLKPWPPISQSRPHWYKSLSSHPAACHRSCHAQREHRF